MTGFHCDRMVLGFANFFRFFIWNYCTIATPLMALLKGKPRKLNCCDATQKAFDELTENFTTAPILRHADPNIPFVVEVYASSCGIGAVQPRPAKLLLCDFFSKKFTPTEVNYNMGNRELLLSRRVWRNRSTGWRGTVPITSHKWPQKPRLHKTGQAPEPLPFPLLHVFQF